jgi:hypothetical protein
MARHEPSAVDRCSIEVRSPVLGAGAGDVLVEFHPPKINGIAERSDNTPASTQTTKTDLN